MPNHLKLVLLLLLVVTGVFAFGQDTSDVSYQDDEFNLFLFGLASIFLFGLLGAAFIGALAAILILGILFLFIAFGIVSTATAIGLYKRSFTAPFTWLLLLAFGIGCSIIDIAGAFLIASFFDIAASRTTLAVTGLAGGALAGVLLAKTTSQIIRNVFRAILQKAKGFTL